MMNLREFRDTVITRKAYQDRQDGYKQVEEVVDTGTEENPGGVQ